MNMQELETRNEGATRRCEQGAGTLEPWPASPVPGDDTTPDVGHRTAHFRRERLQRYLQAYWLRPENALWMTLRSEALSRCGLHRPAADICCGDGIFTFLHQGGVLDPTFDVYWSVRAMNGAAADGDLYDHFTDDYRPPVLIPPAEPVDVGVDLKRSLLAKAARLRFYRRLAEHDGNQTLPFADGSFSTVYCNAAYWVTRIDAFLADLRRLCRSDGRVVLQVKLEDIRRFGLARHAEILGGRFMELIVGTRLDSWPTLAGRETWEARFKSAGLQILRADPIVTAAHARIWEVGLRPIAPLLIRMANGLTPRTRAEIKREWVKLFLELAEPLCTPELRFDGGDVPVEMQYVLAPTA